MRIKTRHDPRFIIEALAQMEATTQAGTARELGLSPYTLAKWRDHRARLGDWPNTQDIADWDANEKAQAKSRAQSERWRRKQIATGGKPVTIDATGTVRRLQALYALGHTWESIGRHLGLRKCTVSGMGNGFPENKRGVYQSTADAVAALYDRLCMTRPEGFGANRARLAAERRGWPPPLAWGDIDNPDARPDYGDPRAGRRYDVDPVVIERIINHADVPETVTTGERREVVRRWKGEQIELERLTGWNVSRIAREVAELDAAA